MLASCLSGSNSQVGDQELLGLKTSGIQATNKLKELEPAFEKAFFDPKFSLGPEADRLYQLLKVAEDVLKGALVTSVDNPDNYLAELLKTTADTGKKMATP